MAVLSKFIPEIVNISEHIMLYTDIQSYTPVTFYDEDSENEADFLKLTEDFIQYSSVDCNIVTL